MRNGVAETLTFSFWERARLPRFANLAPSPGALLIRRGFAAPKRAGLSQRERYQNRSFSAKARGSNQWSTVPEIPFPLKFGFRLGMSTVAPSPLPVLLKPIRGVKGKPL